MSRASKQFMLPKFPASAIRKTKMVKSEEQIDFSQWDEPNYDVQGMLSDYASNNFQQDDAERYRHTNLVQESFVNGQFKQAREMCGRYALLYDLELEKFRIMIGERERVNKRPW